MNRVMVGLAAALAGVVAACRDASDAPRNAMPVAPAFQVQGNGTQHEHFVLNGDRGLASWGTSDASGSVTGSLNVSRGDLTGPATTYLSYDLTWCDTSHNCVWEGGYGLIPNGDLTGSGQGGLHLSTNTAGLAGFYNSGAGGRIVADWRRSGDWEDTYRSTDTRKTPEYTERAQGWYIARSATVVGQMLGVAIGPGYAFVGTNHQVTIQIDRK